MCIRSLNYTCFPGSLRSHCWGEQCVVYHLPSGDTHALSKVDVDILRSLNETPKSAEDLSLEIQHLFDGSADQYIQTLLSSLATLGLIETAENESVN